MKLLCEPDSPLVEEEDDPPSPTPQHPKIISIALPEYLYARHISPHPPD